MRIAILASAPRSLILFRGTLIETLVSRGHRVYAVAPGGDGATEAQLKALGASFYEVRLHRTGTNPAKDLVYYFGLRNLLRQIKPDAVLSYTVKPVIYGSLAAKAEGVNRVFAMITGLGYSFGGSGFKAHAVNIVVRGLYRRALRNVDAVFFQNRDDLAFFERERLVNKDTERVLVNGSGVDLEKFHQAPLVITPVTFLLIARLIKEKGISEYIDAARDVKRRYPNVRFWLLGPIDENPGAIRKEQIESWVAEGIVDYLGETDDVRPYLAQASVFVLPTFYREGVPRTILEAMAMGRPIITTDTPGCRDTVIPNKNGFLVPPRDSIRLAEAMEYFIQNPESIRAMGNCSREIAVQKYDVHKVNEIILETMRA